MKHHDDTSPATLRNVREQLMWLWCASLGMRLQAVLNTCIGITMVAADFCSIWFTKRIIDIATGSTEGSFTLAATMLVAMLLLRLALGIATRWIRAMLGVKAQNRLQLRLFGRMLSCRWQGRERYHSGDVLNRLEQDVREVVGIITETVPQAIAVSVRLVGAFIFMSLMDWRITVLVTIMLPIMILMSRVYVTRMRTLTRAVRNSDSRIQSMLQESVQHRMVIKTLQAVATSVGRLREAQGILRQQFKQRTTFAIASNLTLNLGFSSAYMITFIWSAYRLQAGVITYGMMTAFIQLVGQIQIPFRDMIHFAPAVVQALTAVERMMELEEQPTDDDDAVATPATPAAGASLGFRITEASYRYPDGTRMVLDHFSATFTPGHTTAIVGETGAGKTTLIRLLLGLMPPTEGRVEMFGTDGWVAPCSAQTLSHIVYVPQGNTLLSGTVRDNLLLACPDATDEAMRDALTTACADFVLESPAGLDTPCGELGAGMSEGQAQRICIARSLLRHTTEVLLMDEATSALDEATELRLLQNLSSLSGNRTIIFITHRPAVLGFCHEVLKVE